MPYQGVGQFTMDLVGLPSSGILGGNNDIYSGFNDYDSAFDTKDIEQDEFLQEALRTSHGKRTGVVTGRKTPGTAVRFGSGYRKGSSYSARPLVDGSERPLSVVNGAGYISQKVIAPDPINEVDLPELENMEESNEYKIKKMEIEVMDLIDESCTASFKLELAGALEKAKEASAKEKNLIRFQEETGLADSHNLDLTFLVLFNLASQYAANSMYNEALSTYSVITRNRMFHNSNHLKINMAHIYVQIGDLPKAVKTYRMALDQIPATHTDLRVKIMFNIGLLFVKMGQYNDACNSFEYIMQERPDFKPGLFAILCYFTIGDKEKMKQGFLNLLQVPLNIDEDRYDNTDESRSKFIVETLRDDSLRKLEMEMKQEAEHCILTAVNLLAPVIEPTFTAGYDWCLTALRNSTHEGLAGNLEVNRAIVHLKKGEVTTAIESLKTVEKQDPKLVSIAATNLSFVHFLLGEIDEAEKFAEQARTADGYNTAAFINLANCSIMKGDHEKAKQLYLTALESSGTSIEALYNLGLLYKREEQYEDAIECFLKLHSVISSHPPVLYQLAQLHQLVGDVDQAIEWYLQLLSVVPADPSILQKLGEIYDSDNDKQQAYHFHYEAYRYLPSNLAVLEWLGAYFVTHRVAEKAIPFYEKASLMQPSEPKWPLLVGSCHRRTGNYQQAMKIYKQTHSKFPDSIECLKFLVRLCSDLGLKETTEYAMELKKAEKAKELRERINSSRPGSRRSSGRSSQGGLTSPAVDSPVPLSRRGYSEPPRTGEVHTSSGSSQQVQQPIDATYTDPIGPPQERPRTGIAPPRTAGRFFEDDFGDEEITDDLLPE